MAQIILCCTLLLSSLWITYCYSLLTTYILCLCLDCPTAGFQNTSDSSIAVVWSLSCVQLCDTMGCSTPGFPVLHYLLELAQTHVHQVSDVIQPSHPLLSPSLLTFNLSQHEGIFQWVSSSHQVAKILVVLASSSVLPMNIQDWSPLGWTGWISLQSKGLSRVFFNTTFQKHQFFGAQLSLWSNSHIHTWLWEKP